MSITTGLAIWGAVVSTITGALGVIAFLRTRTPRVAWDIVRVSGRHFALRNTGRALAQAVQVDQARSGVLITAGELGFEPVDVPAGGSVRFTIAEPSPYMGGGWQLAVHWKGHAPKRVQLPTLGD